MYPDNGKRYGPGTWPTKPIAWFDQATSIAQYDSYPSGLPTPTEADACPPGKCPATGATQPTVGASGTTFIANASTGVGATG
jgi:hypothetical protein